MTPNARDNEDLFDIVERNKILEEKFKTKDFILFETKIPTTDFIGEIDVNVGYNPLPLVVMVNYFLSYGLLHEFLLIFNTTEKKTFDYFCKGILDKKELNISETKSILSKRERLKPDNVIGFDFSNRGFFESNKKFSKGSDMSNISFCYRTHVPVSLLDVFLLKEIKSEDVLIVKLPNIVSIVIKDYIRILAYIFEDVRMAKLVQDSFFKDSCHLILSRPNKERYNNIKQKIKTSYNEKGLSKNETRSLYTLFKPSITSKQEEFDFRIKEFGTFLQVHIATYLLAIIKVLKSSLDNNYRNPDDWQHLDFYLSKCL